MNSLTQALTRPDSVAPSSRSAWQKRFTAAIPWILILGFAVVAWILFGDRLLPAKVVQTESVVTSEAVIANSESSASVATEVDPWSAEVLFQSSGWIEPDPLPIKATSLVDGVIATVSVLEGETVKRGQLLATLVREDFELELASAESSLSALRADSDAHEATIDAVDARLATVRKEVEAGRFKCHELEDRVTRLEKAGSGAVAEGELVSAKLQLRTHQATIDALEVSLREHEAEKRRLIAMRETFLSRVAGAETEVAKKKLALDRSEIRSPVDGIVLRLLAVPGQKRMLGMDDPDSSTVAILYRPDSLQARIDVPLEEAAKLSVGQKVRLHSSFLPDAEFLGEVTRIAGEADLQRNTLQAKVRVINPDERLRPDMLCRAGFLSAENRNRNLLGEGVSSSRVRIFVPESALLGEDELAAVFVLSVDASHVEMRPVSLGGDRREGFREVTEGLKPGDRVVVEPGAGLKDGDRISEAKGENE